MKDSASIFQQFSSLDPSFRTEGDGCGSFKVEGRRAQLTLEPDGWLSASVPFSGSPEELFRRQVNLLCLAKIVTGPSLRAEIPCSKKITSSFAIVRSALVRGMATVGRNNRDAVTEGHNQEEAMRMFSELFASSNQGWSQDGSSYLLSLSADLFSQKIVAVVDRGCIRIRADLIRLRKPLPVSMDALVHFLLALNYRLRLARGNILEDRVALEVLIPADDLSYFLIDKAIGALTVGVRMAKRESAALLEPEVAQAYCEFHKERR